MICQCPTPLGAQRQPNGDVLCTGCWRVIIPQHDPATCEHPDCVFPW